jgi:hypothetical protein
VNDIEQLEQRRQEVAAELDAINSEIKRLKVEATGIKIGQAVYYKGAQYKVVYIDVRWSGKPWLTGVKLKRDGTWGTGERYMYNHWLLEPPS